MIPLAGGSSSSSGVGSREILEGSRDPKGVPYVAKVIIDTLTFLLPLRINMIYVYPLVESTCRHSSLN